MAKQPGTGGRPSQQVKVVVQGKQYRPATGSGNLISTPPTVGGKMNSPLGANLPAGSPRKPPTLGTNLK
jgi:hypothetical protein